MSTATTAPARLGFYRYTGEGGLTTEELLQLIEESDVRDLDEDPGIDRDDVELVTFEDRETAEARREAYVFGLKLGVVLTTPITPAVEAEARRNG